MTDLDWFMFGGLFGFAIYAATFAFRELYGPRPPERRKGLAERDAMRKRKPVDEIFIRAGGEWISVWKRTGQ